MRFKGKVWKFGDHVNTDLIIPARYINSSDPDFLAAHCMEDVDPDFVKKLRPGDIIVAGENFGCGSSREHASIAIKAAGVAGVVARNFARIFYRSAFNTGLPIFESATLYDAVQEGDEIEVDGDVTPQRLDEIRRAAETLLANTVIETFDVRTGQ